MRLRSCLFPAICVTGLALLTLPSHVFAQQTDSGRMLAAAETPEAPQQQFALPAADSPAQQTPPAAGQTTPQPAPKATPDQATSSSQAPAQGSDAEKSQHDKAEEQLKQQEKQRVMGIMATFNTTTNKDALPLSSGQKFHLFFKSATDPWPFGLAGVIAGIGQARGDDPEWGQGAQGYAKKFGASYSDYFIGNFFGNAMLPSLWHEDPRYFQKGTGSATGRFLWAASSTVWCRRDNGRWGPNYANVIGNLIGSSIARVYYPASERTVSDTIQDGLTVTAEGIVGSEVIEFWPDLVRHYKRKKAEKLARLQAQHDAESAAQPAAPSAPAANSHNPKN